MTNSHGAARQQAESGSDRVPNLPVDVARAIELAQERKGKDVLLLDLRPVSDATDFFLIVSGTSDMHVRSVAEHIIEELRKEGTRANHVEGLRGGRWVLIDYIDFVVHVFHPTAREFYQLERLWGDAPSYAMADDGDDGNSSPA